MIHKTLRLLLCNLFVISILAACYTPTEIVTQPTPTVTTVPITKTQAPPSITPIPPTKTNTPAPPTPTTADTPTPTHESIRTSTPTATGTNIVNDQVTMCPSAPAISSKRNTWTQISLDPPISNNVRSEPGLQGEKIGKLNPGETIWIKDGPRCADGYTWWFIQNLAGLEGWTVEGDATGYWMLQLYDAFYYDTAKHSSTSKVVMSGGRKYQIVMSGTYSLWGPEQWTSQGVCIRGKSELNPKFPSPLKMNGPVGADPFYHFARPFYGPCQELVDPSETVSRMMFSLDGGIGYSLAIPVIAEYREDHTYTYVVIGQGYPLNVKLDDAVLDDNYGQILITIEKSE